MFAELKDFSYFKQVKIAFGTVQWPHEQDISPDILYLESTPIDGSNAKRICTRQRVASVDQNQGNNSTLCRFLTLTVANCPMPGTFLHLITLPALANTFGELPLTILILDFRFWIAIIGLLCRL